MCSTSGNAAGGQQVADRALESRGVEIVTPCDTDAGGGKRVLVFGVVGHGRLTLRKVIDGDHTRLAGQAHRVVAQRYLFFA